jgi:hypothetical protein
MRTQGLGDEWKRENWGPGPWADEPDRAEWRDEATGYPCLARRIVDPTTGAGLGHWCGYVAVPPGHPWHGRGFPLPVRVHGGVNHASPCDVALGVCHVAAAGEPDDVWWFGFDCARHGDIAPGMVASFAGALPGGHEEAARVFGGEYRTLPYVRGMCELLALQLHLVASGECS